MGRKRRIFCYLNDYESECLDKLQKEVQMSISEIIRTLIIGADDAKETTKKASSKKISRR